LIALLARVYVLILKRPLCPLALGVGFPADRQAPCLRVPFRSDSRSSPRDSRSLPRESRVILSQRDFLRNSRCACFTPSSDLHFVYRSPGLFVASGLRQPLHHAWVHFTPLMSVHFQFLLYRMAGSVCHGRDGVSQRLRCRSDSLSREAKG
jgi:hypothetical protein